MRGEVSWKVQDGQSIGVPLRELWTITQVSEFLGVPVGTLYQWRHKGLALLRTGWADTCGTTWPEYVAGS